MFDIEEGNVSVDENRARLYEIVAGDSRSENLKKLYDDFGEELTSAPASGKAHYHNAWPGGYLDHVLRVHDVAIDMAKTFASHGGKLTFTPQELQFSALNHDLGKLGDPSEPYYIKETSDWHRKNMGRMYKYNETTQYMTVTDRALFLLQEYDIKVTKNEWLAINLSDGLYTPGTEAYLKNNLYPYPMHTTLPHIIHWADHMATVVEKGV